MSSVSGPSGPSSAPALNPGSDLSKLLSSLGLSAAQEQDADSEPQGQDGSDSAGFSPDPLLVSRSRLMRMKADCEHTAALLRRLVDQHAQRESEPVRLAVRTAPSLTDSDVKVPSYVLEASSPSDLERAIDQAKAASSAANAAYRLCASPEDLIAFVRTALTELITQFEALRKELLMAAQNRIKETMKQGGGSDKVSDEANAVADGQATQTVVDEEGQVLNEDGLPFEDPSGEEMAATTSQALLEGDAPRKANMTSEERRRWINDVFNRFEGQDEDDEDIEVSGEGKEAVEAPHSSKLEATNEGKVHDEEDLTMQEEPKPSMKPLKSVLKPSAASPSRQNFGHQGIRRGFLNMNPSSPAAEASSTPVSPADASDTESSGQQMTRSVSNIQGGGASAREDQATVERMTRSLDELVPAGSQPKKAKKSVRIQSPNRARSDRDAKQVPPVVPKSHAEHPDDVGVEDEAARIVDLLGPGVVAGTERGEEALRGLEKEQKEAEEAALQQVKDIKQKREKQNQQSEVDARPALGTSVMERPRKATAKRDKGVGSSLNTQATQAKASAFKRGFLSKPPNDKPREILNRPNASSKASATPSPNVPARQSLGMSALERSLISDKPLEARREEQGLPPTVPHARPSKAYREKLDRKKQAGESSASSQVAAEESAQGPPKVVGTGKEEQGSNSKVRFQLDPSDAGNVQEESQAEEEEEEEEDTELDLDEHDEEAYARAAYASGDKDDDEDDPAMGQEDDEGNASDWSLDSYEYSASDLADLEPTFNGLVSDLESAELAREYALAKVRQMEARRTMTDDRRAELERAMTGEKQRREEGDIWTESDIDGADIVSAVQNGSGEGEASQGKKSSSDPPNRMSRFRASRIVQALGIGADAEVANRASRPEAGWVGGADEADRRADEAGHDLAHMLEGAQNVGPQNGGDSQGSSKGRSPVMILPSMTPVRYPRNEGKRALLESDRLPQEGVDLEGETDEDEADDVLMDVMRTRLEERQEREEAASASAAGDTSSRGSGKNAGGDTSAALSGRQSTPMSNTWEGEPDSRARNSGQSLSAPPSLKSSRQSPAPASSAPQHSTPATTEPPPVDEAPSAAPPSAAPGQKMSRFKAARLAAQQQ